MVFSELYRRLGADVNCVSLMTEPHGAVYCAIHTPESFGLGYYSLQPVDSSYDDLSIAPDAELRAVHYESNSLVFDVTDKYGADVKVFLQVRKAPQIEIL